VSLTEQEFSLLFSQQYEPQLWTQVFVTLLTLWPQTNVQNLADPITAKMDPCPVKTETVFLKSKRNEKLY